MGTQQDIDRIKKLASRALKLFAVFILIVTAVNIFVGQWLFYYDKSIKGQVIDAATGAPIEGALITGVWELTHIIGEGLGGSAHATLVKSDRNGNFVIPAWVNFKPWKLFYTTTNISPMTLIIKPGYMVHVSHRLFHDGTYNDGTLTFEEQKLFNEKTRINPARLVRIKNDEERLKSLKDFELETIFYQEYYSRWKLLMLYKAYEEEVLNLSNYSSNKYILLKSVREYIEYYGGGK